MYAILPRASVTASQFADSALFRHAVFPRGLSLWVSLPRLAERQVSLMEVGSNFESIPKLLLHNYLLYTLYERTHLEIDVKSSYQDNYGCD
ncbi:hypothetical protein, partial [Muribaculum intestinale]|uniref:hypothetical protein n=1 Tax=Muribaculum intestinale TaxID=1796646 RepID=UPI00263BD15A